MTAHRLATLTRLARQGDVDAQVALAARRDAGEGTGASPTQAFKWYLRAAEAGDPQAQVNLGLAYARGRGVRRSRALAHRWYARAASNGNAAAMYNLAIVSLDGLGEDPTGVALLTTRGLAVRRRATRQKARLLGVAGARRNGRSTTPRRPGRGARAAAAETVIKRSRSERRRSA